MDDGDGYPDSPTVFLNRVDGARGRVDYLATSLGFSPASGAFRVGRLRLRVLAEGETWVRFSFSDWRPTDVTYRAQSVLGGAEAAKIDSAGGNYVCLPLIRK